MIRLTTPAPFNRWAEIEHRPDGTFSHAYLGVGVHRFACATDEAAVIAHLTFREAPE